MHSSADLLQRLSARQRLSKIGLPDKDFSIRWLDQLFALCFQPIMEDCTTPECLSTQWQEITNNLFTLLQPLFVNEATARGVQQIFLDQFPAIYQQLEKDAEAICKFDPAAGSVEEVMMAYPGFYATAVYRIAHQFYRQQVPLLPRLWSEHAHSKTGIDIHPGANIGQRFAIDHGTGIVVGETTLIGNDVKLYQGVTLGALYVSKELANEKRHPTIEDNVVIYSGATILGGDTVIGKDSVIGGNVWITNSIPPNSLVYHKSEIRVRDNKPYPESIDFII